jgi:hypothetical protein
MVDPSINQELIQRVVEYERMVMAARDILKTYDRMLTRTPSMAPEAALECIREALGTPLREAV